MKPFQLVLPLFCLCLSASSTITAEPAAAADTATRPDFSGQWIINSELSDDVESKLEDLKVIAFYKRERDWARKREKDLERGKDTERSQDLNRKKLERRTKYVPGHLDFVIDDVRSHFRSMRALRVRHSDPVIRLRSDDGRSRRIYSDGRGAKIRALGDSSQVVSFAGWEGDEIVVESHITEQLHLIERLSLKADTDQFVLRSVYSSPTSDTDVEILLIFDRMPT